MSYIKILNIKNDILNKTKKVLGEGTLHKKILYLMESKGTYMILPLLTFSGLLYFMFFLFITFSLKRKKQYLLI